MFFLTLTLEVNFLEVFFFLELKPFHHLLYVFKHEINIPTWTENSTFISPSISCSLNSLDRVLPSCQEELASMCVEVVCVCSLTTMRQESGGVPVLRGAETQQQQQEKEIRYENVSFSPRCLRFA